MKKITVLIADEYRLVRQILSTFLSYHNRFIVIGESENLLTTAELVCELSPDVLLLTIHPGASDSQLLIKQVLSCSLHTRIIVISGNNQINYAREMIDAGASGYLTSFCSRNELTDAIVEVSNGNQYLSNQVKKRIIKEGSGQREQEKKINLLTRKELDVADLVRAGYSSRQIAEKLMLSVKTIEVHRHNILRKLNLRNSASLVNFMHGSM